MATLNTSIPLQPPKKHRIQVKTTILIISNKIKIAPKKKTIENRYEELKAPRLKTIENRYEELKAPGLIVLKQ